MLKTNELNKTDQLLEDLTEYVLNQEITSQEAFETARYVLLDTLGCGILSLKLSRMYKANGTDCTRHGCSKWIEGTRYVLCIGSQ